VAPTIVCSTAASSWTAAFHVGPLRDAMRAIIVGGNRWHPARWSFRRTIRKTVRIDRLLMAKKRSSISRVNSSRNPRLWNSFTPRSSLQTGAGDAVPNADIYGTDAVAPVIRDGRDVLFRISSCAGTDPPMSDDGILRLQLPALHPAQQ